MWTSQLPSPWIEDLQHQGWPIRSGSLAEIDREPHPWICWARDPVTVRFLRHKSHQGWPVYPHPPAWPLFSRFATSYLIQTLSAFPGDKRILFTSGHVPSDLGHPVVVKVGDEHRSQGYRLMYPGEMVDRPAVYERYWQGDTWRVWGFGDAVSVWRLTEHGDQRVTEHPLLGEVMQDALRLNQHWQLPIIAVEYQVADRLVMCTDVDVRPPCPQDPSARAAGTLALSHIVQELLEAKSPPVTSR